jgi:hypothetical protein
MPRSFNIRGLSLPSGAVMKEPASLVRAALGLLLLANLVAAMFAFHVFGTSPQQLDRSLIAARSQLAAAQMHLNRSRLLTGKIDKGRSESETFLATYASDRRHTYSIIIGEMNTISKLAGMNMKEETVAPLDPIEGSDDLDIMTIAINLEGGYAQVVKFINMLDRSPRFLIIESMTASPELKGDSLSITIRLNALVKDDTGGAL